MPVCRTTTTEPKVIGAMAFGSVALKWTHRAFSNLKRWALGTAVRFLLSTPADPRCQRTLPAS